MRSPVRQMEAVSVHLREHVATPGSALAARVVKEPRSRTASRARPGLAAAAFAHTLRPGIVVRRGRTISIWRDGNVARVWIEAKCPGLILLPLALAPFRDACIGRSVVTGHG